ncbi:hypothetical protein GCM10009754_13330 [Amycolatopsis minnesotensis]|uniref:Uncharacterized protein n=1 Tax=Amycolatopsis minnesotensis TaxID=337894 RepID=A0ABP5BMH9_9PSEU
MQGDPPARPDHGDLRKPAAQAAAGLIPRTRSEWIDSYKELPAPAGSPSGPVHPRTSGRGRDTGRASGGHDSESVPEPDGEQT